MKSIIAVLTMALVLSCSTLALAAPKDQKAGPDTQTQTFTTEQRAQAAQIFEKHQTKLTELREKLWAKNAELSALSSSGKAEKADIQALIADIGKLRASLGEEQTAIREEMKKAGLGGFGGYGMGYGPGACGGYGPGAGRGAGMGMGRGMGYGPGAGACCGN